MCADFLDILSISGDFDEEMALACKVEEEVQDLKVQLVGTAENHHNCLKQLLSPSIDFE